jgi:hypothetical protein
MSPISPSELYAPHLITNLRILTLFGEEFNLQLSSLSAFPHLHVTCSHMAQNAAVSTPDTGASLYDASVPP